MSGFLILSPYSCLWQIYIAISPNTLAFDLLAPNLLLERCVWRYGYISIYILQYIFTFTSFLSFILLQSKKLTDVCSIMQIIMPEANPLSIHNSTNNMDFKEIL